jgi:hypothetical protein
MLVSGGMAGGREGREQVGMPQAPRLLICDTYFFGF